METFNRLIQQSIKLTKQKFAWWVLAFGQVLAMSLVLTNLKPQSWSNMGAGLILILAFFCLNLSTLVLWQSVQKEAPAKQQNNEFDSRKIVGSLINLSAVSLAGLFLGFVFRQIFRHWAMLTVFSSLLFVSVLAAALFGVLVRASFYKACQMTAALWAKKPGAPTLLAVSLMLSHGLAFASASINKSRGLGLEGFSASNFFATIWLLLLVLAVISVAAATFLNIFLVLGFLELIRQKPDMEQAGEKEKVPQPAADLI